MLGDLSSHRVIVRGRGRMCLVCWGSARYNDVQQRSERVVLCSKVDRISNRISLV